MGISMTMSTSMGRERNTTTGPISGDHTLKPVAHTGFANRESAGGGNSPLALFGSIGLSQRNPGI